MDLQSLVLTSRQIAATSRRLEKTALLANFLQRLDPGEVPIAVSYLSGTLRQGKIGIGYAALRDSNSLAVPSSQALTLAEVDSIFEQIAATKGPRSAEARLHLVRTILSRATPDERDFLSRLIVGELRQGSLEGIMIEALAKAAGVPLEEMRRAAMISGDLAAAGRVALEKGLEGLKGFEIRVLYPFQSMLAQSAGSTVDAMEMLREAALEYKMDGIRIQAHKIGSEVRLFTRNLNDVTEAVPDLAEILLQLPPADLILDGEALAFDTHGRPLAFQTTMKRFGRKMEVDVMRRQIPLTPFFFDCLRLNGDSLLRRREDERFAALEQAVPQSFLIPRIVTSDADAAERFLAEARRAGHEGIMAKDPGAPYEPGIRSSAWLKVKPAHTLDLVILAAEWGHGRRRGRLSNLHLG